jgi:hypothetical protein
MIVEQILQKEIEESKSALDGPINDTIYRRDHSKRIELINWVIEYLTDPNVRICALIETKMNKIIDAINQTNSTLEADPLHSDLRILDWILYQVCINEK